MILVQPDAETDIGTQLAHRNRARGNRRDSARQASAPVGIRAGDVNRLCLGLNEEVALELLREKVSVPFLHRG